MRVPNAELAIVSDVKLLRYVLNLSHPIGGPHAFLFDRLLGINLTCADVLRQALLHAVRDEEAVEGQTSPYGTKYEVRFDMTGPRGRYTVLSIWIILTGSLAPQLVTA